MIDRILNLVFVVRTYLTLILCLQTFHRLTPNKGENILADLNLVCIGDEFADVLRVILCADWDGMMTYQSDNSCFLQPSLFVPYFDFTYEYGDKAKVVISWKSV